jgi:hypothetical protein
MRAAFVRSQRNERKPMGNVRLSSEMELEVSIESASDIAGITAAFRATPGSDSLSLKAGQDNCLVNLDNISNVSALWACGFAWENRALEAVINKLMPMAQRRAVMRATMAEARSHEMPDRTRTAVE